MFNKKLKKLSVITICYNEPDVQKTCESIVNQTWQDFDWIVVDGGSNQETLNVFDKYKNRIDKFISEPDKGIYDACNKGIKFSDSEYVIFMNAGDSFYDNKVLEHVFKFRLFYPDVIYGNSFYDFKDSTKDYIKYNPEKMNRLFFSFNNLNTQSLFIKKKLFKEYGLYDLKYKICSDLDRLLCFISNGAKFKFVPYIIANYDKNGISSDSGNVELRTQENNEIRNRYFSEKDFANGRYLRERWLFLPKLTIKEKLFSKKISKNKLYKITTILGIQILIRSKGIK